VEGCWVVYFFATQCITSRPSPMKWLMKRHYCFVKQNHLRQLTYLSCPYAVCQPRLHWLCGKLLQVTVHRTALYEWQLVVSSTDISSFKYLYCCPSLHTTVIAKRRTDNENKWHKDVCALSHYALCINYQMYKYTILLNFRPKCAVVLFLT